MIFLSLFSTVTKRADHKRLREGAGKENLAIQRFRRCYCGEFTDAIFLFFLKRGSLESWVSNFRFVELKNKKYMSSYVKLALPSTLYFPFPCQEKFPIGVIVSVIIIMILV